MSYLTDDEMDVLEKLYDGATKDAAALAEPGGEVFIRLLVASFVDRASHDPTAPERYFITAAGKRAFDRALASRLNPRPKLEMARPLVETVDISIAAPPPKKRR